MSQRGNGSDAKEDDGKILEGATGPDEVETKGSEQRKRNE
jgi:hypothetical protein